MKVKAIEEIRAFLENIANGMGIELVDVEFKQGKEPALTAFIDTENGVDLDTCEKFHRAIDEPLDEFDPTYGVPYTLNVSSPGLDRPLKTERDFARHIGELLEIKLFAPQKGRKVFEAVLKGYDGNNLILEENGVEYKLEQNKIAKVCVEIVFDKKTNYILRNTASNPRNFSVVYVYVHSRQNFSFSLSCSYLIRFYG